MLWVMLPKKKAGPEGTGGQKLGIQIAEFHVAFKRHTVDHLHYVQQPQL